MDGPLSGIIWICNLFENHQNTLHAHSTGRTRTVRIWVKRFSLGHAKSLMIATKYAISWKITVVFVFMAELFLMCLIACNRSCVSSHKRCIHETDSPTISQPWTLMNYGFQSSESSCKAFDIATQISQC